MLSVEMLLDLVNWISSERKIKIKFGTSKFECFEGHLGDVLRKSWERPESVSQGRPLNVRLGRPLDVISGHLQNVRSGRPRDGQVGSLGDVLVTLEGDVLRTPWEPNFPDGMLFSLCYRNHTFIFFSP